MAPGRPSNSKRKRSSIPDSHEDTSTPPKRRKSSAGRRPKPRTADPAPFSLESEDVWKANAILQEKGNQYLIDWANHPETNESYPPSWEPKRNANKQLVDEWKRRKSASKKSASKDRKQADEESESTPAPAPAPAPAPPASTPSPAAPAAPLLTTNPAPAPQPDTTPRRAPRVPNRRVIPSSSPELGPASDQLLTDSSAPGNDWRDIPEIEPRDTTSRAEPAVLITRPADFNFSDYDLITASQVPWESQTSPKSSQLQQSSSAAEPSQGSVGSQHNPEDYIIPAERLLQQPRFKNTAVIPDSQDLSGNSSYVPSTQTQSGAESQSVQTQSQPPESTTAPPPQDSSASSSAQFTNPQDDDDSAPIEEIDPIEDELSSPAAHSYHEERAPPPRESPWQTASSASSPPPTDSPDKSIQSESRVANTQVSVEAHNRTPSPFNDERAQSPEAEVFSRPLSPKSKPEEQNQPSPEIQERQQTTNEEHGVEESRGSGEEDDHGLTGSEEVERPQDWEVVALQSGSTEDQPVRESESGIVSEAAPADRISPEQGEQVVGALPTKHTVAEPEERLAAEVAPAVVGNAQGSGRESAQGEHPEHQQQSTGTGEAQDFVTCPEGPVGGATRSSLQDQADISTQDVTDPPENTSHFRSTQTDFSLVHDINPAIPEEPEEQTNSEYHAEPLQAAQYVPELDLDGPESSHRTQISELASSDQHGGFKDTEIPRRKDSSQDNLELGVLGQADPNIVRRRYEQEDSDDLASKNIVATVETRLESPIRRGYYRKISRGMPQTPQPSSATGGADSSTPGSLTERLREVYARSKAERERRKAEILAQSDEAFPKSPSLGPSTRSPSVIPPNGTSNMEPQYTLIPSNLSAESRPDESHPPNAQNHHSMPDHHQSNDTEMTDDSTRSILLDDPVLGEAEYIIGLSMEGLQGDQYRREIKFKEVAITRFLEDDPPRETYVQEVQEMLKRVGNIITHMDLGFANADALTQYGEDNPDRGMVAWSNNSSTKFRFLGGILDRLRNAKFHFVILGHQGTLMDIIEKFVNGLGIQYSRGGHVDRDAFEARESLFVTILGTDFNSVDTAIPAAHLIFAMDSTVQCHDPKIKALRNHLRGSKDSIPVITPIVTNSVEHVERCISASVQGAVRERLVVRFMTELRQLAGRVDVSTKADHAVNFIVPSIENDLEHHEAWPLPRINSVKDDVHFDESMVSALSVSSSIPIGTLSPSAGQKRPLDVEMEEPTKRTRITPQPGTDTIDPNEITRISDSVPGATQLQPLHSSSNADVGLRAYRKDEKLRKELRQTKERLKEFEEAFEKCQTEKEGQRDIILNLKRENTELKQSQINVSSRIRTQNDTIDSLRNERNALKEQLDEARQQLASSTVPEVAEREQLRRERDDALARLERVRKLREAEGRESDFFRSQYQDASNGAAELSDRVATLTQQVRELERLKAGERDRARRQSLATATAAYQQEIDRLSLQLHERTASLQLRNDELKAIRGRQGVGTRAGSVPRSPRVGGAPGSRGGSPAPSGLGGHGRLGALRNINA
ncbi:chromo domain shadow [Diplodia corticola]|uniref:Chromo domain shadow n=1 Tax=Diplodia corticola TaxID=236234 RepID=A0A1J9QYL4_9PEZI|nr:chromo domain shadow [Diplodia corticola]OJD33473.1 chromo domain shadow [Diplodia corticola]